MTKVTTQITDPKIVAALSAMAAGGATISATGPSSAALSDSTAVIEKPAEAIGTGGTRFNQLYQRYTTLRELARPLNGLSQAAVLPDNIQIKNIALTFSVGDKTYSADIDTVRSIGEIAPLLAAALRVTIEQMSQELFTLEHLVTGMQKSIQQALSLANKPADISLEDKKDEKAV